MKRILSAIALLALIYAAVTVGYNLDMSNTSVKSVAATRQAILDIPSLVQETNAERTKVGLQPLTLDPALNGSALEKCNDMVAKDYWSHDSPDGHGPWFFITKYAYYEKAGENLAYGFDDSDDMLHAWMESPRHKANIVMPEYTNIGFAICTSQNFVGEGYKIIVVQHFIQAP